MKETIEVGYTPAAVVGFAGIYHKYILYTNSNGDRFYARGGPESRTETSPGPFPFLISNERQLSELTAVVGARSRRRQPTGAYAVRVDRNVD